MLVLVKEARLEDTHINKLGFMFFLDVTWDKWRTEESHPLAALFGIDVLHVGSFQVGSLMPEEFLWDLLALLTRYCNEQCQILCSYDCDG